MERKAKDWINEEAGQAFEKWLTLHEASWREEGADPAEVREDVERHLQMKAESLGRELKAGDLEAALGGMSLPTTATSPTTSGTSTAKPEKKRLPFLPFGWMRVFKSRFFLGFWPLLIILIEAISGIFGDIVYDPISRWPQLLLLLGVGGLAWAGQYLAPEKRQKKWFGFLLGIGMAPAIYWGLLSLAVIVAAGFVFGLGVIQTFGSLILLSPIIFFCMLIAAAPIFAGFGFWKASDGNRKKLPWLGGVIAGFFLLVLVEGPAYVTHYGLAHHDPGLVRNWGSKKVLAEIASLPTWGRPMKDTSGLMTNFGVIGDFTSSHRRSVDDVLYHRRFYYQVTGESPDAAQDDSYLSGGLNRRSWSGNSDPGVGGDEVGALVNNLDLSDSRLDGHIDGASGLGYWEWTMDFHNQETDQKEARMQVLLPPDGVVSRLTLWIDGEPQEAAFGAKSQVTAAYKAVVKRRRDPVLVRWIGADRVLVQCFPVPANGKMKIRLGVTAPLDHEGRLYLPRLLEKNFSFGENLNTAVWVQGDREMSMDGLRGSGESGRWRETHGSLSLEALTDEHTYVKCHDAKEHEIVWTEDRFAEENEKILVRKRLPDEGETNRSVVLVVDGSRFFAPWHEPFKKAVEALRNKGISVEVIYAAEEEIFGEEQNPNFVGGQDNLPALVAGLELAGKEKADLLIWLHGAQPIELEKVEGFLQQLERGFHPVKIATVDLAGGPNRLLEQLQSSVSISSTGRPAGPEDLSGTLSRVVEGSRRAYHYSTLPKGAAPEGTQVWDHLARWRVWNDVKQGANGKEARKELAERAARYQLVTPMTGAVVLERQEQYDRFGLEQADGDTTPSIPGIPEPSTAFLLLLASGLAWRRQRA